MTVALDRYIEISPEIRNGRPHLVDTRLTIADIVVMYLHLGQSLEEIAGKYDLPLAAVYAAVAFYYDHQEEVEQSIADDQAIADNFRVTYVSPLQAKLQALKRG